MFLKLLILYISYPVTPYFPMQKVKNTVFKGVSAIGQQMGNINFKTREEKNKMFSKLEDRNCLI